MSTLNIALQCVGLMRKEMPEDYEKAISSCGNMGQLRNAGEKVNGLQQEVGDSLSPCISLLHNLFTRAQWKDKKLDTFFAASDDEFWEVMLDIDASLESCSYTKDAILNFISHCCQQRHYSFTFKKCFVESCSICSPPRLPPEVYKDVHYLPDPVLSDTEEGHYKSFDEVFGEQTTEQDRPSAKKAKKVGSRRFTVRSVKNANLMLQCEECELWRLVYSETKLTQSQRGSLQEALADCVFTCGSPIEDLEVDDITDVYTRPLSCYDLVEKQYYSAGYTPICVYCGDESSNDSQSQYYPLCEECRSNGKRPVKK